LPPPGTSDEMQDIQQRLRAREAQPARFCWNCGKALSVRADLCPFCGERQ
jgi:rRNA maturation endonuclease Nob1